jgi:hypothetical protein
MAWLRIAGQPTLEKGPTRSRCGPRIWIRPAAPGCSESTWTQRILLTLMDVLHELIAIEQIRRTKAIYWYAIDTKDWEMLATILTEDVIFDMREEWLFAEKQPFLNLNLCPVEEAIAAGDPHVIVGVRDFVTGSAQALSDWITVHHGHAPIIEIESEDEARGIWPLFDYIQKDDRTLMGYGHYHERYRRQLDGRWLISRWRLTRLRGDGDHPMSMAVEK